MSVDQAFLKEKVDEIVETCLSDVDEITEHVIEHADDEELVSTDSEDVREGALLTIIHRLMTQSCASHEDVEELVSTLHMGAFQMAEQGKLDEDFRLFKEG